MPDPVEIVILSGKGGTGKTTVTAAFSSLSGNVVFADCDVDAADLHLILSPEIYRSESFASGIKAEINLSMCNGCGVCQHLCRFNAIEPENGVFTVDEHACEGCGLCQEACPVGAISIKHHNNNRIFFSNCRFGPLIYGKLAIAEENSGRLISKIRQHAKAIALENHAGFILLDGPPGIGCPVIASVTGTDIVVAVTEPTISGWHDLERLMEMISGFHTTLYVIINKYDLNRDIACQIENNLRGKGINLLGKLPYDEAVVHALLHGQTITEYEPDGLIRHEVKKMWKTITSNIYEPKSIRKN